MARGLTTAMAAAVLTRNVRPATLVELDFAAGPLYVWAGLGTLIWNGHSFTGTGTYGTISQVSETSDGSAAGVVMNLSGVPLSAVALAVGQQYQGGRVRVWLGFFDLTTHQLIADPYMLFGGTMDVMSIKDDVKSATISISCENRLIELDRPRERRYTDFDQKIDFPNDTGFQYVNSLQDLTLYWGNPNAPVNQPSGVGNYTGPDVQPT